MKHNTSFPNSSSRFDVRRFANHRGLSLVFWLATLCVLGIVAVFVRVIYLEYVASAELEKKYASMRASGEVFDSASMEAQYLATTTTKHREEWAELLGIATSRWAGDIATSIPITGSDIESEPFASHVSEAKKTQSVELLDELAPIIARLRALSVEAEPIRFHDDPQEIWHDVETFMLARGGARVLALDFQYAVSQNDISRAFEDWKALQGCRKIILGDSNMVHGMVAAAVDVVGQYNLWRSLRQEFWYDEQLDSLHKAMSIALDVPKSWKSVVSGERALQHRYFVERLDRRMMESPHGVLLPLSSDAKLRFLDYYEEIIIAGNGGLDGLAERCEAKQREMKLGALDWTARLWRDSLPHFFGFVDTLHRSEDNRRWTLTAIGLRQFKQRYARFPDRLDELKSVGLKPSDWTTVSSGPFGYRRDNDEAILWTYDPNIRSNQPKYRKIAAEPSKEWEQSNESRSFVLRYQ